MLTHTHAHMLMNGDSCTDLALYLSVCVYVWLCVRLK